MKTEMLTLREAARRSGYHEVHLRRLLRAKQVAGRRIGIAWQVDMTSLEYYARYAGKGHKDRITT